MYISWPICMFYFRSMYVYHIACWPLFECWQLCILTNVWVLISLNVDYCWQLSIRNCLGVDNSICWPLFKCWQSCKLTHCWQQWILSTVYGDHLVCSSTVCIHVGSQSQLFMLTTIYIDHSMYWPCTAYVDHCMCWPLYMLTTVYRYIKICFLYFRSVQFRLRACVRAWETERRLCLCHSKVIPSVFKFVSVW